MKSLVLERVNELSLRDVSSLDVEERTLGPRDVRIKIHTVGICGSDVHYYKHGRIGPFVLDAPMVLGHEASGTIIEVGSEVTTLAVGDRVCMEPGIPDPNSRATRLGAYNIDPGVRFWATPPIHGVLRPTCVHPEAFTYKLPERVSFADAAMVEPLAVGIHAATKAKIKPGDIGVVYGAGPIGLLTALSALAGGCARVYVSDISEDKLAIAARLHPGIVPLRAAGDNVWQTVRRDTDGWGADVLFEATGSPKAAATIFEPLAPGGCVVMIGGQSDPIAYDAGAAMVREARIENVFRYAHVFPRCIAMLASGSIKVSSLITRTFEFEDSIRAFDLAASAPPADVKMQIVLPQ